MKTTILILSLGLALCVGIVFYQNHRLAEVSAHQEAAIALVQSRYDGSLRENRELKIALQKKAAASGALTSARAIAARYQNDPKLIKKRTAAR